MPSEDAFYDYDENQVAPPKNATGKGPAPAPADVPLSDAELAALTDAAHDLAPEESFLVGRSLQWSWETGRWSYQVFNGKDRTEVTVAEDDEWLIDVRSYSETWKRFADRKVTHQLGGRRIDGWINCPGEQLPGYRESEWLPTDKGPRNPWVESFQIVLKRVGDDMLATWSAQWSAKRGLSDFLLAHGTEAKDHPGLSPVVKLKTVKNPKGKLVPCLEIIGWEPFGEFASPPANPKALRRIQEKLRLIQGELAPKKASAAKKGGGRSLNDFDEQASF
jgi:hypothetical protein